MRIIVTLLVILVLIVSCNSQKPPNSSALVRLPSGKEIRVYSITRITFIDKSHPPSLLLRYETSLEPDDSKVLREEVQEVWKILQPKADSSGDSYAMIKANEPIRGAITQTHSFTYGFIKMEKGEWKMREPQK
jgi:hypothetical protein